jgi:hypothetical protein
MMGMHISSLAQFMYLPSIHFSSDGALALATPIHPG